MRFTEAISMNKKFVADRAANFTPSVLMQLQGMMNGMDDIIDLSIGDPDFTTPEPILTAGYQDALKGYTRLNYKGFQRIRHGGILFTFSCSQVVSKDHFRQAVFTAAALARRKVRILHQLHQPADHPINIYHPEGEYLKGLVLFVE